MVQPILKMQDDGSWSYYLQEIEMDSKTNQEYIEAFLKALDSNLDVFGNFLIIGGGDLQLASSFLEYYPNCKVTVIDPMVNNLKDIYLSLFMSPDVFQQYLDTGRLTLIPKMLEDETEFKSKEYDAVIVDISDPVEPYNFFVPSNMDFIYENHELVVMYLPEAIKFRSIFSNYLNPSITFNYKLPKWGSVLAFLGKYL